MCSSWLLTCLWVGLHFLQWGAWQVCSGSLRETSVCSSIQYIVLCMSFGSVCWGGVVRVQQQSGRRGFVQMCLQSRRLL